MSRLNSPAAVTSPPVGTYGNTALMDARSPFFKGDMMCSMPQAIGVITRSPT